MGNKEDKMTPKEVIGSVEDDSQIFSGKLVEGRRRIAGTIDEKVDAEFKRIHTKEKELAQKKDRTEPAQSHTLEMLLKKGIRTYKEEEQTK
jgi:hypothetical protein